MKIKYWALISATVFFLTGCTNTAKPVMENNTNTSAVMFMEEISSSPAEETLPSFTGEKLVYIDQRVFPNNKPCQSISIIEQGAGQPKLLIKVSEHEEFYFDPPALEYPKSINEIYFTDLNGDGVEEIIAVCMVGYYPGIYIIDIANHSYLVPPYVNDTDFSVGVEYNIYSVDENHIQIKNKDFNAIVNLSYHEIWEWNGNPDISKKEEYFKPYREIGKQIGSASPIAYQSVKAVTYNNHNCLKLIQRLCGPWGQFDHLGYMETIISWDTDGEFHIESITYLKRPPMGTDDPRI